MGGRENKFFLFVLGFVGDRVRRFYFVFLDEFFSKRILVMLYI